MDLTPYHAKYYALELTKRCPIDSVEKLAGALVDAQENQRKISRKIRVRSWTMRFAADFHRGRNDSTPAPLGRHEA